nr:AMP-binding protein [Anaerolineae bacterium]
MSDPQPTINQSLLMTIRTYAAQPCFEIKKRGRYNGVSYRDFEARMLRMVRYLHSYGVSHGERVALVANNSGDWMATCVAGLFAGGVVVPLRPSLAAPSLLKILQDCEACVALLDEEDHVSYISAHASDLPHLKAIMVTLSKLASPPWIVPVNSIFAEALPLPDEIEDLKTYAASVPADALALISYVPNEEGEQRGAMFDQGQLAFTLNSMASWFTFEQDDLAFTIMPWTETASLLTALHCFVSGVPNALIESVETIPDDLKATSPTLMLDIPYTYAKFYEAFTDWLTNQPEVNQKVVQWAIAKGKEYRLAGVNASPELRQEHLRADMTFFSWYRGRIGGRFRKFYVTGGAPAPEVAEFFEVIGIPLLSVYSTTEAGGFPAVSFPSAYRPGSASRAAPGYKIRLAEDSELLVHSPGATQGYWRHPQESTCLFDEEGWLRCGDTATIDEDGFVHIIDRKRQMMVLNLGRKIMPAVIEKALVANEFIAQAAVFAEGKPYVSAMI